MERLDHDQLGPPDRERSPRHDNDPDVPDRSLRSLSEEKKLQLGRKFAAWRLSQFLHGEQGALMVCGQLVDAVPDLDAKMNAAAQVFDEARHVEGFRKYITKLDRIYPIDPTLERLLTTVMANERWEPKYVGIRSSPRAGDRRVSLHAA